MVCPEPRNPTPEPGSWRSPSHRWGLNRPSTQAVVPTRGGQAVTARLLNGSSTSTVAIGATDHALGEFCQQRGATGANANQAFNRSSLRTPYVVEFENDRVRFPAIDAGIRAQVVVNKTRMVVPSTTSPGDNRGPPSITVSGVVQAVMHPHTLTAIDLEPVTPGDAAAKCCAGQSLAAAWALFQATLRARANVAPRIRRRPTPARTP
jgi:hypothetical protein